MEKQQVIEFPNLIDSRTGKTLKIEVPAGTVDMKRMMAHRGRGWYSARKLVSLLAIKTLKAKPIEPLVINPVR